MMIKQNCIGSGRNCDMSTILFTSPLVRDDSLFQMQTNVFHFYNSWHNTKRSLCHVGKCTFIHILDTCYTYCWL